MKATQGGNGSSQAAAAEPIVIQPPAGLGAKNLDRVREILLGRFTQDLEARLRELDAHLERHTAALIERLNRTEIALGLRAERILDEFTNRIEAEADERTKVFESVSQALHELRAALPPSAAKPKRKATPKKKAVAKAKAKKKSAPRKTRRAAK